MLLSLWSRCKRKIRRITDGPDPAYCCEFNFELNKITYLNKSYVKHVDKEKIVDTNGAGDSFAGGFLSQYVKQVKSGGKVNYDICMKAGHWAAALIIQRRGCQLPRKADEDKQFKITDLDT